MQCGTGQQSKSERGSKVKRNQTLSKSEWNSPGSDSVTPPSLYCDPNFFASLSACNDMTTATSINVVIYPPPAGLHCRWRSDWFEVRLKKTAALMIIWMEPVRHTWHSSVAKERGCNKTKGWARLDFCCNTTWYHPARHCFGQSNTRKHTFLVECFVMRTWYFYCLPHYLCD